MEALGAAAPTVGHVAAIPRLISTQSQRHAEITDALDAGVPPQRRTGPCPPRRPRTTQHDARARGNLDSHAVHFLTATSPESDPDAAEHLKARQRCVHSTHYDAGVQLVRLALLIPCHPPGFAGMLLRVTQPPTRRHLHQSEPRSARRRRQA